MFLATTALDQFWKKDEEILFLGTWCLRRDRPAAWQRLRYRVMSSPWDNRNRFYEAAAYVDEVGERILRTLAEYCNSIHGTSYSERYWRILLGPWLLHAVHTIYDRYVHLQEALRLGVRDTIGLHPGCYRVPPTTAAHFDWLVDDYYNLQVYTQLLEVLGLNMTRVACEPKPSRLELSVIKGVKSAFRDAANACLTVVERLMRSRARVMLYEPYITRASAWQLSVQSGFRVLPMGSLRVDPETASFDHRRLGFKEVPARSEFERLFVQLLPYQFPTVFLEGYRALADSVPRIPAGRTIVSANAWFFNDRFKMTAATQAEKGTRLVAIQHGGGYGMYRSAPAEVLERRLADRFMVWGWANQDRSKLYNMPGAGLSRIARRRPSAQQIRRNRTILFVPTAHPRYLYRFHSSPVGTQWEDYFDWQRRFFNAIAVQNREQIVYRPSPADYGNGVRERISAAFPELQWDLVIPAAKRLPRCRFVVIDHCATTLLEALVANVPTILFWDPERWETRPATAAYVDALREVKILFDRPEDAAAHLQEHLHDPLIWWRSAAVQHSREKFVSSLALATRDWQNAWTEALMAEANRSDSGPVITHDVAI